MKKILCGSIAALYMTGAMGVYANDHGQCVTISGVTVTKNANPAPGCIKLVNGAYQVDSGEMLQQTASSKTKIILSDYGKNTVIIKPENSSTPIKVECNTLEGWSGIPGGAYCA